MVELRSALVLQPLAGGDLGPQLRTPSSAVADGAVAPPGTVVPPRVAGTVVGLKLCLQDQLIRLQLRPPTSRTVV